MEVTPVLCDNLMETDLDEIRMSIFSLLEPNEHLNYFNNAEYVRLLGLYSALYQYASELYVYCLAKTRYYTEKKDIHRKIQAMDRRDMLEQYLKAVKMNYDSLSRKITVFKVEDDNGA